MNPSYTVIPSLDRNRIEAGEPLEIDLYLSGYGPVERSKLYIQQPDLLDETDPGEWTVAVRDGRLDESLDSFDVEGMEFVEDYLSEQDSAAVIPLTGEDALVSRPLAQPANRASLVRSFFLDDPDSVKSLQRLESHRRDQVYPGIVAEATHDGHPPIQLRLNTRPDAHSGDYAIQIVFTYGNNQEVYQDVRSVDVHVKTPREQLEPVPTLARVAGFGIAVTGLGWTVSPYVGVGVFGAMVLGGLWYRRTLLDLFEPKDRD